MALKGALFWRRREPLVAWVAFCVFLGSAVGGAVSATRPVEARVALAMLGDTDAAVREKARDQLMGLSRAELPELVAAIREALPLEPSQLAAIREIVPHVYLSGEKYDRAQEGFLGVRMSAIADAVSPTSIVIESRFAGFAGYRYLRDGDMILDIEESPLARPIRQEAFSMAVRRFKPGQTVHLIVLRHGERMRIAAVLDARPAMDPVDELSKMDEMVVKREEAAERYWKETVGPLIQPGVESR